MKKTIVALMALASVAAAADNINWYDVYKSTQPITLNYGTGGVSLTIPDAIGDDYFLANVNGDKSPALGKFEMTFTLTNVDTAATVIAFSNDGKAQCGWGVTVTAGALYLGQMTVNPDNTTSAMPSNTANCTKIGDITANVSYTLSVISYATGTKPGRGSDNFAYVLTSADGTSVSGTASGFGLNGTTGLKFIELGGTNSASNSTTSFGKVTSLTLSIPEPTTATLSLLALVGLAARRRRK